MWRWRWDKSWWRVSDQRCREEGESESGRRVTRGEVGWSDNVDRNLDYDFGCRWDALCTKYGGDDGKTKLKARSVAATISRRRMQLHTVIAGTNNTLILQGYRINLNDGWKIRESWLLSNWHWLVYKSSHTGIGANSSMFQSHSSIGYWEGYE